MQPQLTLYNCFVAFYEIDIAHDFRTRLNSTELRKIGKEFLLNAHNESGHKALSLKEFEIVRKFSYSAGYISFFNCKLRYKISNRTIHVQQAMGHLGFDDLPLINRIFDIFDADNSSSIDYREMVCGVDLLLRGHGEETSWATK